MNRRVFIGTFGAFLGVGAVNAVTEMLTGEALLQPSDWKGSAPQNVSQEQPAPKTGSWTIPVNGPVGTAYGVPGTHWASGHHTGIDFTVPEGTAVSAVADGTVVTAGWGGAYGKQIVIKHGTVYTQYAHLSSIDVREGQTVRSGQQIGRSGSTGNTTGPHLHFEVRTGAKYGSDIDPLKQLEENGASL